MPTLSRRSLLQYAGATTALAAAPDALAAGQLEVLSEYPQQLSTPLELFDRLLTPTEQFFVRSHFGPPALDRARRLSITGLVKTPLELTAKELARLPQTTVTAVLQCAGNGRALVAPAVPGVQWVHGAMGQATWTGVRLSTLLERAGVLPQAAHLHVGAADRPPKLLVPAFRRSLPLAKALDPNTLVAWKMNGEPLTLAHGAPLRLVVPGWAGDHWVKWLANIHLAAEEEPGFFVQKAYRIPPAPVPPGTKVPPEKMVPVTTFPVKSVIARPTEGTTAPAGPQEVVGVAFSGEAGIAQVEVSVDGGATWSRARLEGRPGPGTWQVFRHAFVAKTPGELSALARATDASGATQPEQAVWNPSGYYWNAWHRVSWRVS